MNTSPDSERSGPGPEGPQPGSSFFGWLRSLGIVRGSDRWFAGVAGGIAAKAGIDPLIVRGVFVVLALLGGPGLLIYLIGWLLLPDSQGRIHTEDIFRGRAETWVLVTSIVLASVLIIPAIFGLALTGVPLFGAPSFWGWDLWATMGIPEWLTRTVAWLFWITILVLGFFWLRSAVLKRGREQGSRAEARPAEPNGSSSEAAPTAAVPGPAFAATADGTVTEPIGSAQASARSAESAESAESSGGPGGAGGPETGDPAAHGSAGDGSGTGPTDQTPSFADRTEEFANRTAQQASDWGQRFGEKANNWGEDVGRQADEWSARYAEHHDAHRLGTGQTILTLALALLAAGLTGLWVLGLDSVPAVESVAPAPLIAALIAALAVLSLSLIVAGVRGRYTGWVGFLSACGVVALLATVVLPWGMRFQPFGNVHVEGLSTPGAVVLAGNTVVDLRSLDSSPGEQGDLEIWQLAGNATVTLPESRPTAVRVHVLAGNISEQSAERDGARISGPFLRSDTGVALERTNDAFADDSVAHVTVYLLAGNVRIEGSQSETSQLSPAEEEQRRFEELQRAEQEDLSNRERAERLEEELDLVEWQLQEPGLSFGKRQGLEDQRDRLREELNELEQEMAR
ncbi:PspC domain-containing protein [Leucobacter celer]|uniref:PspC domain-containing protein n=1 Tax=Leucobacter celer TaxID=668625 RepID=UPI0006A77506|nr:PspC domain-containing protein [Leucobacter celer]